MRKILEDINNRTFRRAYLLYGTEEYLKLQFRDKLLRALDVDRDSMNFAGFAGKNIEEREILANADTMPFLAERRVILLEDTGLFKAKTDRLPDYLASAPEYLTMIFVEKEADKRSRLFKAVQKNGYVSEFNTQDTETLIRWVRSLLKKENKILSRPDAELFLSETGSDMSNISQELEKLICYTLGREEITGEDIKAVCSPRIENRVFDMVRAVTSHDRKAALAFYHDLLALKEPAMRILFLLSREYNILLQVLELRSEGISGRELADRIKIPPFAVKRYESLCRRYTPEQIREILRACAQTEEDIKTGRLNETVGVELLLVSCSM